MAVDAFVQPLRDAADSECRGRHSMPRGGHAHRSERLGPHAGHDEQPRFAHQHAKPRFVAPSGKHYRHVGVARPRSRSPAIPKRCRSGPSPANTTRSGRLSAAESAAPRRAATGRPSSDPCGRQTGCRTIRRHSRSQSASGVANRIGNDVGDHAVRRELVLHVRAVRDDGILSL